MNCPICGEPLVPVDERHYETLQEHVGAPNRLPILKTGYGCVGKHCPARHFEIRWVEDGEGPFGGYGVNFDLLNWRDAEGSRCPKGTWHWEYAQSRKKEARWTFRFSRFRLRLWPSFQLVIIHNGVWKYTFYSPWWHLKLWIENVRYDAWKKKKLEEA